MITHGDLLPFVKLKKNMKKPGTLLKVTLPYRSFPHFLNCTDGTKSRNASHTCIKKLRLFNFLYTDMYLGPCETFFIECFAKVVARIRLFSPQKMSES